MEFTMLISSYQGLKDSGRGASIVNSIVTTAITCNLDKDIPEVSDNAEADAKDMDSELRDLIVGKVYGKLMEIESRLLQTSRAVASKGIEARTPRGPSSRWTRSAR